MAPAITCAWPSSSAAMRCTDPINAPRPPPTIPARRRRKGWGIAMLLIADASQGMTGDVISRIADRSALAPYVVKWLVQVTRQPHLATGITADDDIVVLATKREIFQRQRLPPSG